MSDSKVTFEKGNVALAKAAVAAGCRYYFGYPITPQSDIPEYLSGVLPRVGGQFVQAESEVASINMLLGAGATGKRAMTSSSSPGISLKQEGISYMAGSEVPGVIVNVQRSGPGLGGIAPSQGDYFQATRGGGHGDYRVIVLAPASVQEMYDLTVLAFDLADTYRTPVMVLADAMIGMMKEPLEEWVPQSPEPSKDDWAATGAAGRPGRRIKSLYLGDGELAEHNWKLAQKYERIRREETRVQTELPEGCELAVVAFGSAARIAKSAVDRLNDEGRRVGYVRPITLWPFPDEAIRRVAEQGVPLLTVELNTGQMVEDVRLAVEGRAPVHFAGYPPGYLPSPDDIYDEIVRRLPAGEEAA
ncbi:3-methyl-2-oxobutanoate dehydrogenase subunit VorB [Deferrisoma camini]|uniref:3-methyl-2-oxobutanoate dehydrogenase subunit VorB n=1 Tax=Deferrisoma camini TaxID=1035120 RepID=UPI00046CB895|nr:3-methyl-2-oxobutanoate dehydrogenase subunit VorB [Deferrisoma camini]